MTRRDEGLDEIPEDLANAYRALPPLEPSAELGARVRAAVTADLDATKHSRRNVLALPRRIPMLPLATAATVLVAVGVGYLAMQQYRPTVVASRPDAVGVNQSESEADLKTGVPDDRNNSLAEAPSVANGRSRSAPPHPDHALKLDMPVPPSAAPAPPPAPPPEVMARVTSSDLEEAVVTGREAPERVTAPVTLDDVRKLLHEGKRPEALTMLRRWQAQNHDAAIPDDLRPLLEKVSRQQKR